MNEGVPVPERLSRYFPTPTSSDHEDLEPEPYRHEGSTLTTLGAILHAAFAITGKPLPRRPRPFPVLDHPPHVPSPPKPRKEVVARGPVFLP